MEEKMKKLILAFIIAAMGMFYSASAEAFTQSTTGSINVTATVAATCSVNTAPLDFGALSILSQTPATTSITVNCAQGTLYRIDIDAGLYNIGINGLDYRYMKKTGTAPADGTNTARYHLYQDIGLTILWGDNGATFCPTCSAPGKTGIGTGTADIHTVYGMAPMSINGPGSYSDTLTVTVNY